MFQEPVDLWEFGPFSADLAGGALRRNGTVVPLTPTAFKILTVLVRNHGRTVSIDELMNAVWEKVHVEPQNIAVHVFALRKALGDDRNDGNRYIETVPKRGYRFVAPVTVAEPELPTAEPAAVTQPPESRVPKEIGHSENTLAYNRIRLALPVIVLAGLGFWAYRNTHPMPSPRVLKTAQLTQEGGQKGLSVATDGLRLYFTETSDTRDILASVSTAGGAIAPIATPWAHLRIMDLFPDPRQLLLRAESRTWRLPLPAGSPPQEWQSLASVDSAGWSHDGKFFAFSEDKSLFRASVDGSSAQKLTDAPGGIDFPRWSPDDRVIRFTVDSPEEKRKSLWEVQADGTNLHRMFPDWPPEHEQSCGNWTSDGRYFFFMDRWDLPESGDTQVWAMRDQPSLWHETTHKPVQITHDGRGYRGPVRSPDSRQIFAVGTENRGELLRYDFKARGFLRLLNGLSAFWVSFSNDGQKIAY